MTIKLQPCYICGGDIFTIKREICQKPLKETNFKIDSKDYCRVIVKCNSCNVYCNFHNINLDKIYSTVYNELSYKNDIQNNYKQILSYHYSNSDNKHRVERIINYFKLREKSLIGLEVLDVGSGLCVFLGELKKYGTRLHCVDPSRVSIDHAIKNVGVDSAFEGEFLDLNTNRKYDLITFNKVLEHVKNPKDLVLKAKGLLKKDGTIYIELPDGKKSSYNGGFIDREEFYLEHYTIFTKKAIRYLAESTMLNVNVIKQIHEPSDKYTIYSFLNNSNY